MTRKTAIQEIEQAFYHYLKVYFTDRDLESTLKLLSPHMSGFGTALDERGDTIEQSRSLYLRDVEQAPNSIEYTIKYLDCQQLSPEIGLVRAEFDMHTEILGQGLDLLNARMTALFRTDASGEWLLEHQHLSLPTSAHGESEAYPVKELEERAEVLERLVVERTCELQEMHDRLEQLAITDSLTGVYNRMKGDECLEQELSRFRRYRSSLSVILLDLDNFKSINDTLGHGAGDSVLRGVGSVLLEGVRESDVPARWGGEEFLILCPESTLQDAAELAERLRLLIGELRFGSELEVHASFGVAEARSEDTRESLVERADAALYRAKHQGRNRVEIA